jgi:hypothetical protein
MQRETAPHRGVRGLRNEQHDRHLHLRAPLPIAMIRRRQDSRIDRRRRALEQSVCATPGHATAVRTVAGRGLSATIALPFSITGVASGSVSGPFTFAGRQMVVPCCGPASRRSSPRRSTAATHHERPHIGKSSKLAGSSKHQIRIHMCDRVIRPCMLDIDGYRLPGRRTGDHFSPCSERRIGRMEVRLPNDRDGVFICGASVPVSEDSTDSSPVTSRVRQRGS